jgi:hypothetical protein
MDLGAWLRDLDLEEYEAAFRQNHIDATVLPSLTAEDLKDLGIGSIGHRRKLLEAIALLRAETTTKAPPPVVPTIPKPARDTAERRQVTVMFSDLQPVVVRRGESIASNRERERTGGEFAVAPSVAGHGCLVGVELTALCRALGGRWRGFGAKTHGRPERARWRACDA